MIGRWSLRERDIFNLYVSPKQVNVMSIDAQR
jgi:hypothetical protein